MFRIRIRIQSGQWIRIRILNPAPDPGEHKMTKEPLSYETVLGNLYISKWCTFWNNIRYGTYVTKQGISKCRRNSDVGCIRYIGCATYRIAPRHFITWRFVTWRFEQWDLMLLHLFLWWNSWVSWFIQLHYRPKRWPRVKNICTL